MGLRSDCYSSPFSAAYADGSFSDRRWSGSVLPPQKFLAALTLGHAIRYTILAYLAAQYGRRILTLLSRHGQASLWIGLSLISIIALISIFFYFRGRSTRTAAEAGAGK